MKPFNRPIHKVRHPRPPTIADRFLASGQRLRANETMTSTTFALAFAAKRFGRVS